MIESVHIRNFQSLHDVEVELGPFTVIVGPSSSGKSAFMRGVRCLTSNRRGAEFISYGERTAAITARTDKGTVTLTRGKAADDNHYVVTPLDEQDPLYPSRTFKKLGGETPPEVSRFLGIEAKDPINYAGQFDKPYLLDDSSGEVARTLGALTNVHVIFEAARESNRRKLAAAQQHRTRAADLQAIKEKIPSYRNVKAQAAALTEAEEHIERARALDKQQTRLHRAIETLTASARALAALEQQADIEIPSEQPMLDAQAALRAFDAALRTQQQAAQAYQAAEEQLTAAQDALYTQEEAYADLIGELSDDMAGWVGGYTLDATRKIQQDGKTYIEEQYVIEMLTAFVETRATQ